MDYKKLYEEWLANPYFDENTKAELKAIEKDENEIKERFYKDLEFGTAGLRGVIGAGTCLLYTSRGKDSRKEFFDRIIHVISLLGGDLNHVV